MSPKQEILPPSRSHHVPAPHENREIAVSPPRVDPGGVVSSTLMRWTAERHTSTLSAVAARTRAEADLFDAQSGAMESYIKRQRIVGRLQELPEIIATDRARRRAERAEELREVYHRHEIAETRRLTEVAYVDRELLDAQQALKAQRDHGYGSYELEWKKRSCEMLDVELSAAERRAILRQHLAEIDQSDVNGCERVRAAAGDDALDDALYEARAQLLANGLDVSRIDALIERRRVKI
jgi:hypothetical protein